MVMMMMMTRGSLHLRLRPRTASLLLKLHLPASCQQPFNVGSTVQCFASSSSIPNRDGDTAKNANDEPRQVLLEHRKATAADMTIDTVGENKENSTSAMHQEDNYALPVVSILTLNRPKAANAMGAVMLEQLQTCISEMQENRVKSRCLILTSCSAKVFSAGADLKERRTMSTEEAEAFVTNLRNTMHQVSCLPLPVLAAIDGLALGGGLELALAADIRVASSKAILGLPETSLAIIPGAGGTQRLPRLIGTSRAKELIFTGQRINGQTAFQYGLVDHVVENDGDKDTSETAPGTGGTAVLRKAIEIAWKIAQNGPIAIQAAKQAVDQGMMTSSSSASSANEVMTSMQAALEIERQCYARTLTTKDRLEGLAAFRDGRKPNYRGE
jgi:methylglutaconyl-CoA hydratase